MNYYLCPRCNFKIAGKARLCTTCGYKIPRAKSEDDGASGAKNAKKGSFFAKFFGMGVEENKTTSTESGKEKPALS